jgi:hypothetical protein
MTPALMAPTPRTLPIPPASVALAAPPPPALLLELSLLAVCRYLVNI